MTDRRLSDAARRAAWEMEAAGWEAIRPRLADAFSQNAVTPSRRCDGAGGTGSETQKLPTPGDVYVVRREDHRWRIVWRQIVAAAIPNR